MKLKKNLDWKNNKKFGYEKNKVFNSLRFYINFIVYLCVENAFGTAERDVFSSS